MNRGGGRGGRFGVLCGEGFEEGEVGDDGHKDDEGATQGLVREDVGKLSTEIGAEDRGGD